MAAALGEASAQRAEAAPTLTLILATKVIRAPALRADIPNSLDRPVREAMLRNQADLGVLVVTPSRVEEGTITSIQHGAPHTEEVMVAKEVMVVKEVMGVRGVIEVMVGMGVMEVIQVDISTITQTTKS